MVERLSQWFDLALGLWFVLGALWWLYEHAVYPLAVGLRDGTFSAAAKAALVAGLAAAVGLGWLAVGHLRLNLERSREYGACVDRIAPPLELTDAELNHFVDLVDSSPDGSWVEANDPVIAKMNRNDAETELAHYQCGPILKGDPPVMGVPPTQSAQR